jgi:adenine deaminase
MNSDLKQRIDVAAGRRPADLVLKGGRIVNVLSGEIQEGDVAIARDRIAGIGSYDGENSVDVAGRYICPGLIDGHVHIESSMLSVLQFASVVAPHGTVAVVTDPHEIANVMGVEGIRYMLSTSEHCPLEVYVMLSSCVPASHFESPREDLTAADMEPLLSHERVLGIAEMMNFPGVVAGDPACLDKVALAGDRPVDGHAPGLSGRDLCAYVTAGIGSDHECTTFEEAREKLRLGMTIMIREGSQARNLEALLPLVTPDTVDRLVFVTDDKDVEDLLDEGHINFMIRRAVAAGVNPIHAVRMASWNTARYFGLNRLGAIAPGKAASLVVVDDLKRFNVLQVYQAGRLIVADGQLIEQQAEASDATVLPSSVNIPDLKPEDFRIFAPQQQLCGVRVIEVLENRIDTERSVETVAPVDGQLLSDPSRDLCKIAVIERHNATGRIGLGFVRGFGLAGGALASTVAHDAHNLVVVGTDDHDMLAAANDLKAIGGGLTAVRDGKMLAHVPLPVAGLMTDATAHTLRQQFHDLHEAAAALDARLRRPFMALAFLSLSVIGKLKITDRGLVDVEQFKLIELTATDQG